MRVFWDTNIFIYYYEDYGAVSEAALSLRARMRQRGDTLITSSFALAELLVKPASQGPDVVAWYESALARHATLIDFDTRAARHYATIRQSTDIRPPDVIQLACAAASRSDLFVTNDGRLSRKLVPGVPIMSSLLEVPI